MAAKERRHNSKKEVAAGVAGVAGTAGVALAPFTLGISAILGAAVAATSLAVVDHHVGKRVRAHAV
jgi:drug/metabolite transporter (DMT)-like permease